MTTEKYVAKIRHGYTSVKELEREIFCIKCAKKCYSPAAFALHYDRHLLTNKTSAATSNRCDLTIKELTQAFFSLPLAKPGSFLFTNLDVKCYDLVFSQLRLFVPFYDSEHSCSSTAMAWLRPIVLGRANITTAPPATSRSCRCTSTT